MTTDAIFKSPEMNKTAAAIKLMGFVIDVAGDDLNEQEKIELGKMLAELNAVLYAKDENGVYEADNDPEKVKAILTPMLETWIVYCDRKTEAERAKLYPTVAKVSTVH
jgi:hypothetical protein